MDITMNQYIPIPSDVPVYRLLEQFYGPDDNLYQVGEVIEYLEEPNTDMEPMNEPAKLAMRSLYERLEAEAKELARLAGKPYRGLPKNFDDTMAFARSSARKVETVQGDGGLPVMGAHKDTNSIRSISLGDEPDEPSISNAPRRGRPTALSKVERGINP